MKNRELMHKASNMSDMDKSALICRFFGYIEIIESRDESVTADDLYKEIENTVNELTKENS